MLRFIISAEKIRIINQRETSPLVKYYAPVFAGIIFMLLILSLVSQAYANDLTATLITEKGKAIPTFTGVKNITIKYPEGSSLAQQLDGKNDKIDFIINGTSNDASVAELIQATNKALAEVKSPVQVTAANVHYIATIRGGPDTTLLSVKVDYQPTLEKFVLSKGDSQVGGDIIDLQWREFVVVGPVKSKSQQFGEVNMNQAIGALETKYPDIASKLSSSEAGRVLQEPILDFNRFNPPMSTNWHHLFDPISTYGSGTITNSEYGTAKVLSVYSLGESSLREGKFEAQETTSSGIIDGVTVNVKSSTPAPSAQITVAGYLDVKGEQGQEFGIVASDAPAGAETSSGGFPIQVLLVLGGMMGAIAVFVLFKARK
jgi:hypothetical protein